MPNILIRQDESEQDRSAEPVVRWGKYGPLVLAGAMALGLWAFSGGQKAGPPVTTGMVVTPAFEPTTSAGVVTTINEPDPVVDLPVRPTTNGKTAIGTVDLHPSGLVPVALSGGADQLVVDSHDVLWWRADWGLGRFDPAEASESTFYEASDDLFFASVTAISPAPEGGIWVAGRDSTLRRFSGERFTQVLETPEPLCQLAVSPTLGLWAVGCGWEESQTSLRRADPELWESGGWLYRWIEDGWEPDPEGRPLAGAAELTVDLGGNVWVANREVGRTVNSQGLSVFDGDSWTTYTANDGLPSGVVQRIAGALPDGLWIRTFSGPSVFNGTSWRSPTEDPQADRRQWRGLMSIVRQSDGLVATSASPSWKLLRTADGTLQQTFLGVGHASNLVQANGHLWVADKHLLQVEAEACRPDGGAAIVAKDFDDPAASGACLRAVAATAPDSPSDLPPDAWSWQLSAVSKDEALLLAAGSPWQCTSEGGCEIYPGSYSLTDLVIDYAGRAIALSQEELLLLEDGVWTTLTPITAWEALRGP